MAESFVTGFSEDVLEAALPIIDPHHHFYDKATPPYLLKELLADIGTGHNVQKTVYVECESMYATDCPPEMGPVGETVFANDNAARTASGGFGNVRAPAAIVGYADLMLGEAVRPILEAHIRAGHGRFRGIRNPSLWDADERPARFIGVRNDRGLLLDPRFRTGFAHLAAFELSFDALVLFHQLGDVIDLARTFQQTTIILDHCGFPIATAPYTGRRKDVFAVWKALLRQLACEPNVVVKLGGLGMPLFGFGFEATVPPPGSEVLANAWRPYIETCIEMFGTDRCMFESNFPEDRPTCTYRVLWNAFKRITSGYSSSDKSNLFNLTASRVYRIEPAR